MKTMFISDHDTGLIYRAELVRKGSKRLRWSVLPDVREFATVYASSPVDAGCVPVNVRQQAQQFFFEKEKIREKSSASTWPCEICLFNQRKNRADECWKAAA